MTPSTLCLLYSLLFCSGWLIAWVMDDLRILIRILSWQIWLTKMAARFAGSPVAATSAGTTSTSRVTR